jgi:hypothetical protein
MPSTILGQQALTLPVGTTAQRPTGVDGMIRKNSSTGYIEYWNVSSNSWLAIGAFAATGGTVTTSGSFTYHAFTTSSSLSVTSPGTVDVLMAGGGGGGGRRHGGGGGAGGLVVKLSTNLAQGSFTVTVGSGGAGETALGGTDGGGQKGTDSTFNGWTALGGGAGWGDAGPDIGGGRGDGGSGGGCEHNKGPNGGTATQPGSATGGFGNRGGRYAPNASASADPYCGGGGGGANGVGGDPVQIGGTSNGGAGLSVSQFSQFGVSGVFCGGGGGGQYSTSVSGSQCRGGAGGGGNGQSASNGNNAVAGTANTGGGGGGDGSDGAPAANGGSGIVIIRYAS